MTDDLLEALAAAAAAPEPDAQWLTTREIQLRLHLTQAQALARLRELADGGRLDVQWVVRVNLAGAQQRVPAYRLKQTPGG